MSLDFFSLLLFSFFFLFRAQRTNDSRENGIIRPLRHWNVCIELDKKQYVENVSFLDIVCFDLKSRTILGEFDELVMAKVVPQ